MTKDLISTSDIGALLGYANHASTRKWIFLWKLVARGRDIRTGEKQYSRSEVEEALANRPGQGARTDLRRPMEKEIM